MRAIRVTEPGGPEALVWTEVDDPVAEAGTLVVDIDAAGVNFIDTYHRSGLYPMPLPFIAGVEGAGIVAEVGEGVEGLAVGDRVAWTSSIGSYAQRAQVPARVAVVLPDGVSTELGAATMLQGMTAHFLACSTFPLESGHRCLIHAGAGGVGLLLIQIAKMRGAEVFTTVGTQDKAELATGAGADHVINYRDEDFGDAVERIAGPRPLDVIYDGVGADTFDRGLEVLRPRGTMATFGNASGPVPPMAPLRLSTGGSLFLTRPTLADHTATRDELEGRANDLFGWIAEGRLDVRIGARFPLADARSAHEALQGRATTGKVLLIPSA
ncbi:quinone oxidoreductase family protein [Candidatus Poriferisodalis sp.]|uniref:quinone oxidoreductase family protein n=1 Tax=Candidatus Poriferisodalis sp. TaxID=3101277 RepID=UPI003B5BE8D8